MLTTEKPLNRGMDVHNYTDSWHLSLFLPRCMDRIAPRADGYNNLPIMWPFLHGDWIVATDTASMVWCRHVPESCPIDRDTLQRPMGNVRKHFAKIFQQCRAIPQKDWWEPGDELDRAGLNYVIQGVQFDADLVDRFRGLGVSCALSQTETAEDGEMSALFIHWGETGGGVILPTIPLVAE